MTIAACSFPPRRASALSVTATLFALVVFASLAQSAFAQSHSLISALQYDHGIVVSSPSRSGYSKQNNLRLIIDTRWTNNHGYRPIRLQFVSRQNATSERRLSLRLHIVGADASPLVVQQSFDLPQGAREATAVVRVPWLFGDDRCWWDVWVDGVRDPELSMTEAESWNISPAGTSRSPSTILAYLHVSEDAQPAQLLTTHAEPLIGLTATIDDLPTAWIDYSTLDFVAITPRELSKLESVRPAALRALRLWVRAGGQLWVHSVGKDAKYLAEVERCLELANVRPLPEPSDMSDDGTSTQDELDDKDNALVVRGWRPLSIGTGRSAQTVSVQHKTTGRVLTVRDAATIARLKLDLEYVVTDRPSPEVTAPDSPRCDTTRWYLDRPVGLGRVRIFRGGWDPVAFSVAYRMLGGGAPNQPPFEPVPATPVSTAFDTLRDWTQRHGLTPDQANDDFADFLVPGVGLAPVTEFRVLITLFVLVIGPLNYWLLLRANRLHLLLLTVPATALGLTASLFGYALLSDGLGTVVRTRSFTSLDQSTGEAASWARLSYYAGLAPGEGLTLDEDVALYPILSEWGTSSEREADNRKELRHRDGRQQFTKGWLRSRVPTQYLMVRARKTPMHIDFARSKHRFLATNRLGTRILYLAVVDDAGNVFTGESIENGAKTELQISTHGDALRVLRDWMLKNQPQMPIELAVSRTANPPRGTQAPRPFRGPLTPEDLETRMSDNVLNAAIANLVAGNAEGVLNVPRRSYVAITETGPEIELGVADATEEASFHVLHASW